MPAGALQASPPGYLTIVATNIRLLFACQKCRLALILQLLLQAGWYVRCWNPTLPCFCMSLHVGVATVCCRPTGNTLLCCWLLKLHLVSLCSCWGQHVYAACGGHDALPLHQTCTSPELFFVCAQHWGACVVAHAVVCTSL